MTPEERAAKIITDWSIDPDVIYVRVVAVVREAEAAAEARERERCAKLVESCEAAGMGYTVQLGGTNDGEGQFVPDEVQIAAAIRAGGGQ